MILGLGLLCGGCATPASAPETLRVGTSGDYSPFSVRTGDARTGFDIAAATAFAEERRLALQFVEFRWPDLAADLAAGRFDVAMSGVTVRPDRSLTAPFTRPVALSSAVAVVADPVRFSTLAGLDAETVTIAVNAGGHLERVTRARFPSARVVAVADNRVPERLASGAADALVTDTLEAPSWLRDRPGWKMLPPFTTDRKAWWVHPDRSDLLRDLDRFAAERSADGSLARWRAEHLGPAAALQPTAAVLPALFWRLRERLELMPLVAETKRRSGSPIEVPEREERVVGAAWEATRRAAAARGRRAPPEADVRRLFRAQIEAAKSIQRATLAGEPRTGNLPSLEHEIRPALLRLGDQIAGLIVDLAAAPLPESSEPAAADELEELSTLCLGLPGLESDDRAAITAAIDALRPRAEDLARRGAEAR
ncbi:MAG: transporter substrate-binding domain-containing protein [Myxococcales bacterium]|nr:transporter substrate-binding domain-containing protein [Myxococcales bacterium]